MRDVLTAGTRTATFALALVLAVACTPSGEPVPREDPNPGVSRAGLTVRRTWERAPLLGARWEPLLAELNGKLYLLAESHDSTSVMELWDFNGTSWRRLAPSVQPPQRQGAAFARFGDKLVLFGGMSPSNTLLNDTWEWDGGTWTQKTPPTSPPPRYGHVMTEAQGRLVLFGGTAETPSARLADTWEWDGTTWTQRLPTTSPSARTNSSMGTAGSHAILFGGLGASGALGETWRWDGNEWTQLSLTPSPSARYDQGSATVNGQAWIVAGRITGAQAHHLAYLSDVWRFDGTAWVQVTAANGPSARSSPGVGSLGGSVVVLGGTAQTFQDNWPRPDSDVFLFNGTSWLEHPSSGPDFFSGGANSGAGYEPVAIGHQGLFTLHGRTTSLPAHGELWRTDGNSWSHVDVPTNSFPILLDNAFAIDPSTGHGLLLGWKNGFDETGNYRVIGETWEWNGTSWRKLNPATTPTYRAYSAMAAFNGTVVLFGGQDLLQTLPGESYRDDTWVWNGTTWTQLTLTPRPPARSKAGLAQAGNRLILFGGEKSTTALGDTWAFDGSAWTRLTGITTPPAMHSPAMTSLGGKALLFGGTTGKIPLYESDQTWEFDGTQWVNVSPLQSPPHRFSATLVSLGDRAILYGGSWSSGGIRLHDVWTYRATAGGEEPDTTPPTAILTAPASGALLTGTVPLTAAASDNSGVVTAVDFLVDETLIGSDDSAPYGVSWDTRSVPNGPHTLKVRARDAAGNVGTSAPVTVTADNDLTSPVVSLTAPAPGARVSGTVTLSANATDNQGVTRVEFHDGTRLLGSDTTSPFSFTWNTEPEADGEHVLTASAYDAAGNVASSAQVAVTVWHDTTPPSVSITAPGSGALIAGTVAISVTATDEAGVTRVEFLLDGNLLGTDTSSPYGFSWNTRTAADGNHTLIARATDASGLVGTATVGVRVDNTNPTVALTNPINGALLKGLVGLQATASDEQGVARVEFFVDGTLIGTATSHPYSVSWNSATVANGTHTLTARAYDTLGLSSASSVLVTVDNTPPAVTLTSPVQGTFLRGAVTLEATASDNHGIWKVEFYRTGALIGTATTAPYSITWHTTSEAQGNHILAVKAYDLAANTTTSYGVQVTVDNTAPMTAISAPANNTAVVGGMVQVGATAGDNLGVARVELYVDGTLIGTDTTAPYGVSWNSTTVTDGFHALTSKAYDRAGNEYTSAALMVNVDNLAPDAALTSPAPGTFLRGTALLAATASDNLGGAKVEFLDGTAVLGTDTTAPYELSWDTLGVPDGARTLTVRALDGAGNVRVSAGVTVTVDNTAPVTAVSAPTEGALLRGVVPVSATASDAVGVERVEFYAGTTLLGTSTSAPYGVNWDTAAGAQGSITLTTRAYDAAGNVTVSTGRTVTVDNVAPTVAITSPANGTSFSFLTYSTTIQANASDNRGVTQVVFYDGATVIGTDTTAPYSVTWNLGGVPKGTHTLTARAHDAAGNVTTSAPISVKVN